MQKINKINSFQPKRLEFSRYTNGWRPQSPISLYFLCSKTWKKVFMKDQKKIKTPIFYLKIHEKSCFQLGKTPIFSSKIRYCSYIQEKSKFLYKLFLSPCTLLYLVKDQFPIKVIFVSTHPGLIILTSLQPGRWIHSDGR